MRPRGGLYTAGDCFFAIRFLALAENQSFIYWLLYQTRALVKQEQPKWDLFYCKNYSC